MIDATWNLAHVDDESDLTELSSDEEGADLVPTSNKHEIPGRAEPPRRTNSNMSSTFEISRKTTRPSTQEATQKSKARPKDKWPMPAVESHKTISFSAKTLYELINKGRIELNPEYQRGIVWSEQKQSNFINSLYHGFHAPEIVFNVAHDPDTGSKLRTCMDGKQRLTSICNLFDGKIPLMPYLSAADVPGYARRKFWSKKNGSATRPLIPPHVMDNLETSSIACVEYVNLSPDLEREIFQRVQHGVPLTPSDRLPAINGPWADVVRELRNRMNTTEGFEGYLDWGKARGKDFQALAQIVYLAVNGTSPKKSYPSSQRIETFLNSTDGKPSSAKNPIISTMDIFCRMAKTPGINEPLITNLSPLEFVMTAFLIFQQRTLLTDRQLSVSICKMREHARRRTEDMKFSQPNFKVFSDFVLKSLPKLSNQLTSKGGEKPAACTPYKRRESGVDRFKYNVNLDTDSAVKSTSLTASGEKSSGKRKRATEADSDDEDEDWIVEAPATKARAKKESQSPTTKADPFSKAVNRQRDAESKARTTVKKTQKSITRSPVIKTPPPKLASSKIDGQVGKPSIRPTPSMAVQQASKSASAPSGSPTVLSAVSESTPTPQASRAIPSRMRDSQMFRARVFDSRTTSQGAVDGSIPPSSSTSFSGNGPHGRPKVADDPSTMVITRNVGAFSAKSSGMSPPFAIRPVSPVNNRRDTYGSMAPGTGRSTGARDVTQPRDIIAPRASLQSPGPISSRGGILPSPLEDHY